MDGPPITEELRTSRGIPEDDLTEGPVSTARRLAPLLKAIADEHRLAILLVLAERECTVVELTTELGIGQTLASHHLKALRDAGLVAATPVGRSNVYAMCCEAVAEPVRYLAGIATAAQRGDEEETTMTTTDPEALRDAVRERYAAAARAVQDPPNDAAVEAGCGFGGELYDADQAEHLPADAFTASLGCGNPTMLADLEPGQVVLDLGSGGGIDVLLSARRVGPTGKVYGLDMTPEMLELAEKNRREAGVENVEFLFGTIEDIPLPDDSVDVIISNCVINLSADKDRVLAEAHRVLRSGGLFAVSDVVLRRPISSSLQGLVALWTGCVAGALVDVDYESKLSAAGFTEVEITPTLIHDRTALERLAEDVEIPADVDLQATLGELDGAVSNAFIRARA